MRWGGRKEKSSFGICVTEPTAGGIKALLAPKEAICWLRFQCREIISQSWVWDCGDAVPGCHFSQVQHPGAHLELAPAGSPHFITSFTTRGWRFEDGLSSFLAVCLRITVLYLALGCHQAGVSQGAGGTG